MNPVPSVGHPGIYLRAIVALFWFWKGRFDLTQEQFETHFDNITSLLELVNDERHRLTPKG